MAQAKCAKCKTRLAPATVSPRSGSYCAACLPATRPWQVVTEADMEIRVSTGPMPAHLAKWGETEETWDRCQAMWTLAFSDRLPEGTVIRGCPLGRSPTREGAILDLIRRTNAESNLNLTLEK